MENLKTTMLYEKHQALGAKLVPFGGFNMPLYYTSINDEHLAVRDDVGIFDVSHMGELIVSGNETIKFLNYVLSAKITVSNKIIYSLLLNDNGGVIDDLMVYPFTDKEVMLVVNASNIEKDFNHLVNISKDFDVVISNRSNDFGCLAIQGPNSFDKLKDKFIELPVHSSEFIFKLTNNGPLLISRSGYTGEDGFEVYGNSLLINDLWDKLLTDKVKPIGLGARDTLRFEAAMPLYGNELSDNINPLEAGLKFAVDFNKSDFIGKDALLNNTLKRKVVALELIERNIAREGYEVYSQDGLLIGIITTGYLTPSTKKALAFALVDINYAKLDTIVNIKIRNKMIKAFVRNKSFIKKNNKV